MRPIEPIILWSFGTTLVGLLYLGGDKSEKVCTGYEVLPTKGLNLLKESKWRASVQIVLCNLFLYTNNIQKYYSVSRCVIFIIIVIAPTEVDPRVMVMMLQWEQRKGERDKAGTSTTSGGKSLVVVVDRGSKLQERPQQPNITNLQNGFLDCFGSEKWFSDIECWWLVGFNWVWFFWIWSLIGVGFRWASMVFSFVFLATK